MEGEAIGVGGVPALLLRPLHDAGHVVCTRGRDLEACHAVPGFLPPQPRADTGPTESPHPEERAAGQRLEGWQPAPRGGPPFETLARPLLPPTAAKRLLAPQGEGCVFGLAAIRPPWRSRRRSGCPAAAGRGSRATSCPRTRCGTGRAAAARAPPCRRSRRARPAGRGTSR